MQLPSKLNHGENFKTGVVNKINSIIDYLKTQRLVGDNKTIIVNQLTSGVGLSVITTGTTTSMTGSAPAEGGGDGGVVLAQVRTWDPINGSTVNLYPNGKEGASVTGKIYCPELAATSKLNAGDWILAHKLLVLATGGND